MKKKLPWIIGALVALVVVVYVAGDLALGAIVRASVNRLGPSLTQTKVVLDGATLSPLSGSGTLSGFLVGNPPGWSSDRAFYFAKVHVSVAPSSIFSDTIIVNDITIDRPEFVYETRFVASNIGDLLKNIEKGSGDTSQQPKAKSGQPRKFIVKHFEMTNGRVVLGVANAALTLPMPTVTMDNLGLNEGGITSGQLALAVMRSLTESVVSATTKAAGKIGGTMGAAAGNAAKSATGALKGLFNGQK